MLFCYLEGLDQMVFKKKKKVEEEVIEEPEVFTPVEVNSPRHASPQQDTMISLEEYNAIQELLHPGRTQEELDARTDVNSLQIIHFSRARIIAKRFGIKYLDEYVSNLERLSLSHKRKSRLEHVKALSGLNQTDQKADGLLNKLF